ncbi:hypothetical protein OROMI_019578 [Orobanche minor]
MRQIEKTIQYLIGSGMDPRMENNPYLEFIYTLFQERATFVSHGGSTMTCSSPRYAGRLRRTRSRTRRPTRRSWRSSSRWTRRDRARLGRHDAQGDHNAAVPQRLGVYTARDYADILEFLVAQWEVEKLTGLSGEGRKAQEYVCGLPLRIRKLEERAQQVRARQKEVVWAPFSWIFGREIMV